MDYPAKIKVAALEEDGDCREYHAHRFLMPRISACRTSRLESLLLFVALLLLCVYAIVSSLSSKELSAEEKKIYENTLRVCDNRTARGLEQGWPKIIHQTWKNHDVPERYRKYMKTCQDLNPDYHYMFWTDEDIAMHIDIHYPWFVTIYESYPYKIQKIDSGRLFIMHHYGGVYIDIDIECKVPLETIRENANKDGREDSDIILARTDPIGITNNILMGKARHPFYDFLIHRLPLTFGHRFSPHWTVMLSAGPIFLYRSYLIYPCKSHVHLISTSDHSDKYFHHVQARTWHSWDGPFITWFDYHGRSLLLVTGVALVLVFVGWVCFRYWRVISSRVKQSHHQRWPSDVSDTWIHKPEISAQKATYKS